MCLDKTVLPLTSLRRIQNIYIRILYCGLALKYHIFKDHITQSDCIHSFIMSEFRRRSVEACL